MSGPRPIRLTGHSGRPHAHVDDLLELADDAIAWNMDRADDETVPGSVAEAYFLGKAAAWSAFASGLRTTVAAHWPPKTEEI